MTFRTYFNSKSAKLVDSIIKTEDLHVSWETVVDALGDTMIEARGAKDDVQILRDIFTMVA